MSYSGYLVKLGDATFPMNYILTNSYKTKPKQRQDIKPYRDAEGKLHRNVVSHKPSTIEFQLRNPTNTMVANVNALLNGAFTNADERKLSITYYVPESDDYQTGEFYMPNPEYSINHIQDGIIYYNHFTLEFIEY